MRVAALCGGVGAARLLPGLAAVVGPRLLTAIVNVGDDCDLHGLAISPDLDTITYTVAGQINAEAGWGLSGDTWGAMAAMGRFAPVVPPGSQAGCTWFSLGDRDLATHLYRTGRRAEGAPLSQVTREVASAFGVGFGLLPVTDDRLRTLMLVDGEELGFQSWFVGRRHQGSVQAVRFEGAEAAVPAPGVLEALADADRIVVCPSNPIVSIGPLLAVPAVRHALERQRHQVIAVSPIIAGAALKGPAASLLADLGHEVSAVGVARAYKSFVSALVLDQADADLVPAVEAEGVHAVVAPTVMRSQADAEALACLLLA
ncbi:MAG: 2-phospho-L-lactate transferase [Acidimicrobiales bacterium]